MIKITTGDAPSRSYEILDVVFAYGNSQDKFLKTANPLEAYPKVKDELAKAGERISADMIINATFDYRVATKQGCGSNVTVFEVFAYGTGIKFTQ